jgi:UV DNA damage endonuclease
MREVKRAVTATDRAAAASGKAAKGKEVTKAKVKATARVKTVLLPPIWTGHSDFTNPFEFATFMRMAEGLEFDVMMEGKSKDVSIIKLRPDLLRFAPDVAARFGIHAEDAADLLADERALEQGVAKADDAADPDEAAPLPDNADQKEDALA